MFSISQLGHRILCQARVTPYRCVSRLKKDLGRLRAGELLLCVRAVYTCIYIYTHTQRLSVMFIYI